MGLGGRLDATNIVDPSVAVITSIALDHTDWLGNDRESIGREKAGIFRSGKPAVVGEPDMPNSIRQVAETLGAPLYRRGEARASASRRSLAVAGRRHAADRSADAERTAGQCRYRAGGAELLPTGNRRTRDLHRAATGDTAGAFPDRAAGADADPRRGAQPARRRLSGRAPAKLPRDGGKVRAVVGMLSDKDIAGTLACLSEQVDEWYCAPLDGPRGASVEQLAQHLTEPRRFNDVETAWRQAMQDADKQDIVIVCGSFHTVAQVMAALDEMRGV